MNIFWREMTANRRGLIIWCVCLFLLVASGMAKYASYSAGGQSAQLLSRLPQSMKALLGFGSFDPTTISGYFAMLFLYIELAVAVHAALLGSSIIAKEERDKTTEFLMVKPVARYAILTSKLAAAFVNVVILNLITWGSSMVLVQQYNKGNEISSEIGLFMRSMFLVQIIFLVLGTAVAASQRNAKSASSVTIGILLVGYVISRITSLTDRLNVLDVFSPFQYFSYARMVNGQGLNPLMTVLVLVLFGVLVVWTYLSYQRRDLGV